MDFSVLMAVYHKESPQRLQMALQSNIVDQTLKPRQLVLVCDGPLNEMLDGVIEKYESTYPDIMKVYRLKNNGGLGQALKYGLEKCDYELVARSDSDDVCAPKRFELQISYMQEHPEVSASSGTIDEFCDDYTQPKRIKHLPLTYEELCKYARNRSPLNHMATIFRKSDILEVGSYEHLQYLEDYYLWVRLIASGKKIGNVDEVLVHACVGNGMVERRGDKRHIKSWKTLGKYMVANRLQSWFGYVFSIAKITLWCYFPPHIRTFVYNYILRNRI